MATKSNESLREPQSPASLFSEKEFEQHPTADSASDALKLDSRSTSNNASDDGRDVEKATSQPPPQNDKAAVTITAQDWNGPDDPDNPMNWPLLTRIMHIFPVSFLGFAVTAGSSLITPATPDIEAYFHISRTAAVLALSLFVLGLGLGPVIAAPMSEAFGRSVVYKITAPVFMLFILGSGFSKSLGSLLVCRLLAGMAGGPVLAVGGGTVADLFPTHVRAIPSALYVMSPFLGPALGPVMGGFVAQYKGWRWTQWCTLFIAVAAYAFVLPMKETYKKVILKKRAQKLHLAPPAAAQIKGWTYWKMMLTITVFRPLHMLFTEPIVFLLSLYTAFTFSVLFAFFAAYPFTFESVYGFNTWQYGLTFLGIGIGVLLAVVTAISIDRIIYMGHHRRGLTEGRGMVAPEHRLYAAMVGSLGIPIGLFWFGWSARADVHWISPVLAGIPFAWGNLCIFVSAATYLIDVYGPLNGASALAANGLARYGLGAAFPLFTFQMYGRLGVAWATSLLGFISVAMIPIPFVFWVYGKRIRERSQYETQK